jgi:hypothetical protein
LNLQRIPFFFKQKKGEKKIKPSGYGKGMVRQAHHDRKDTDHPEPFDSPFVLSLSKDERFAQDRLVEGRLKKFTPACRNAWLLQALRRAGPYPLDPK